MTLARLGAAPQGRRSTAPAAPEQERQRPAPTHATTSEQAVRTAAAEAQHAVAPAVAAAAAPEAAAEAAAVTAVLVTQAVTDRATAEAMEPGRRGQGCGCGCSGILPRHSSNSRRTHGRPIETAVAPVVRPRTEDTVLGRRSRRRAQTEVNAHARAGRDRSGAASPSTRRAKLISVAPGAVHSAT